MAADWDSGSYDADADTVKLSETSTSTAAAEAYEVDPDAENYASGNDPETAYQNHGRPDTPNGLGSYADDENSREEQDGRGDYRDATEENSETREFDDDQALDMWGDADPDAANYADIDGLDVPAADGQDVLREDEDAADHADAVVTQQDQATVAATDPEHSSAPEQQRISALEAENAEAKERIADLEAEKNDQAARLDRIEQFVGVSGNPENSQEHDQDNAGIQADRQKAQDVAIAQHEASDDGTSAKQARDHGWRRVTSSESLGLIGTFGGAAQAIGEFAAHATPEGSIGLGLTALGVAQVIRARAEKNAEKKGKK